MKPDHRNRDFARKVTLRARALVVPCCGGTEKTGLNWLGRKGSNLRMTESKSVALPLGDSPKTIA
ncbi:hypothetical protein EFBL_2238 [Effusibacillus lacus]|uniref:Uncharacterized protein n=1 Tax=Effusibacillus lacus TaxID=1348429 RepID=A0A292YQ27_9BACL|nr:hypothetical protein EFBL_2238 [Effusibacillus lacus]